MSSAYRLPVHLGAMLSALAAVDINRRDPFLLELPGRLFRVAVAVATLVVLAGPAMSHGYASGSIKIEHPWAPPTASGATAGAVYMKIINVGDAPIRLLGGVTSAANRVELHSMSMDGNVMRMRPVTDGLVIPARGQVALRPGGLHFMLVGLKAPLVEEDLQPMTLNFEGGISVEFEFYVEQAKAGGHGH